jgi:hypothetical protein
MEIKTSDYHISYDNTTSTIYCQGSFRLGGTDEYTPIADLCNQVADLEPQPAVIRLNLRQLAFLNSSGINMLSKFIIRVRQKENILVVVQGSQKIPWQGKSLKNLQRLMPSLQLEWE